MASKKPQWDAYIFRDREGGHHIGLKAIHHCRWYRPELGSDAAFLLSYRNEMCVVWVKEGLRTKEEAETSATDEMKSEPGFPRLPCHRAA